MPLLDKDTKDYLSPVDSTPLSLALSVTPTAQLYTQIFDAPSLGEDVTQWRMRITSHQRGTYHELRQAVIVPVDS